MRTLKAVNGSPPAIWAAFAAQSAWKSWVMVAQLAIITLLIIANVSLAKREPDVVVVGPDGKSTYVQRTLAGAALTRFLAEQKGRPSDITLLRFSRRFLELSLAINSTTIEEAWAESLSLLTPGLREQMEREAAKQKLVESYKLAQVKTELVINELQVIEAATDFIHVRAEVTRKKTSLAEGGPSPLLERLQVELIEEVVPRSFERPDGLEIADFRVEVSAPDAGTGPLKE